MQKKKKLIFLLALAACLMFFVVYKIVAPEKDDIVIIELENSQSANFENLTANFKYKLESELSKTSWRKSSCTGTSNTPRIEIIETKKATIHYFGGWTGVNKIIASCIAEPALYHMVFFIKLKESNKIKIIKTYNPKKESEAYKKSLLQEMQ